PGTRTRAGSGRAANSRPRRRASGGGPGTATRRSREMPAPRAPARAPRPSSAPSRTRGTRLRRRPEPAPVSELWSCFAVIHHAGDIDDNHRFVADHPGVVPRGEQRNVTRPELFFAAVVHPHAEPARHVVL